MQSNSKASSGSLFYKSVTEGLDAIGKDTSKVVIYHVCRRRGLEAEDMVSNPEVLVMGLREVFREGFPVIEKLILKSLNRKIGSTEALPTTSSIEDYFGVLKRARSLSEGKHVRS